MTDRVWIGLSGTVLHALVCAIAGIVLLWQPGFYGEEDNGGLLAVFFAMASLPFLGVVIILLIAAFLTTRRRRLWRLCALLIDTLATAVFIWALALLSSAAPQLQSGSSPWLFLLAVWLGLVWLVSHAMVWAAAFR